MNQSPEPANILRFTAAERWTHRTLGILMGVLLITAAVLYLPGASAVIGYRPLMRNTHIIAGFLLPIPIIVACFFWAFRQDLRRLSRWAEAQLGFRTRIHYRAAGHRPGDVLQPFLPR